MDLLLNDDVLGAEKAVEGGTSSYHKVFSQAKSVFAIAVPMKAEIIICLSMMYTAWRWCRRISSGESWI